ncbi:hypothetical protein CR194_13700 [Salipaludibacillus keqinensis]|uniref:GGDEF domain-containing protein n=1 Tax=Salipaludibacillus keqinensis TaxID=2045207 RepID=A0A323TDI6_9BACI|nr:GGDEF domain-containing protein [Salipaludibacillus keqinensis]PYZ92706.1 hypothetical protein CR194_13700 [Salipaludibacillus keqinensis]
MYVKGRIFSVILVFIIQSAYIFYYFQRDGYISLGGWLGYPLLLPIGYWTGYQFDKAKFFSEKDSLTHLYNRRFIEHQFQNYSQKAKRNGERLFVLLLDCDKFKRINDRWGHAAGDNILIEVAKILQQKEENVFAAARWGGDEFLVVGSCEDAQEVDKLKEKLNKKFSLIKIPKMEGPFSISIGGAVQWSDESNVQEVVKQADAKMYEQKSLNKKLNDSTLTKLK